MVFQVQCNREPLMETSPPLSPALLCLVFAIELQRSNTLSGLFLW